MLFNSIEFGLFLPFALLVFWFVPRHLRVWWLLGMSYIFYMHFFPKYGLLLFSVIVINYLAGRAMERWPNCLRLVLWTSLALNLGLLGVFKYAEFVMSSFQNMLHMFGGQTQFDAIQILLPIGISFYTFQGVSYTVDCYRGKFQPIHEFELFAAYISFFPQLIAGPIVRADEMLPQLRNLPSFSITTFEAGVRLFLLGLFKKVLLADGLAPLADAGFASHASLGGIDGWVAALAFTFQIYFDFSGYTDIARGCGRMFCLELPENFRLPYLAASPREFWRRWHITLSTWLRDYLYISLGGNRCSRLKMYRNLLITMGLGGLWHGAAWNFVLWGLFHGIMLVGNHMVLLVRGASVGKAKQHNELRFRLNRIPGIMVTFFLVVLGWVLFRAENMEVAFNFYHAMFRFAPPGDLFSMFVSSRIPVYAALLVAYHAIRTLGQLLGKPVALRCARVGTYVGIIALVGLTVYATHYSPSLSNAQSVPFLYFQF